MVNRRGALSAAVVVRSWSVVSPRPPGALVIAHRSRWSGRLAKPVVLAPIVGATKPHHLTDAAAAVAITLTKDEVGMAAFVGARSRPSRPWPT